MPPKPKPLMERVMNKIVIDERGCWMWQGSTNGAGYPQVKGEGPAEIANRRKLGHRLVYEAVIGPIPHGYVVDHLCYTDDGMSNRLCLNPDHLDLTFQDENSRRGWAAKRERGIEHHLKGNTNHKERDELGRYR